LAAQRVANIVFNPSRIPALKSNFLDTLACQEYHTPCRESCHRQPVTETLMSASFEEKSAWIQLIAIAITLGAYFVIAGVLLSRGVTEIKAFVPIFVLTVTVQVVVMVASYLLITVFGARQEKDERDRVILWRAEAGSGWILGVGVLAALGAMVVGVPIVWIANGLLAALVVSELLRCGLQVLYYRRGV
ncbi:MAG: hypothetical protein AAGK78_10165, partial [Planctomycetota bacterium]